MNRRETLDNASPKMFEKSYGRAGQTDQGTDTKIQKAKENGAE